MKFFDFDKKIFIISKRNIYKNKQDIAVEFYAKYGENFNKQC